MKILFTGGREYDNTEQVYKVLEELARQTDYKFHIIVGDCRGLDTIVYDWAEIAKTEYSKITNDQFEADWDRYGKRAGMLRNLTMIEENPDLVIQNDAPIANVVALAKKIVSKLEMKESQVSE